MWTREDYRRKQAKARQRINKHAMTEKMKVAWTDERRAQQAEKMRARRKTPSFCRKRDEVMKSPEYRAKMSIKMSKLYEQRRKQKKETHQ